MTEISKPPRFSTEQIAFWFFRINGCLNIPNFLVHHERQGFEGTDVDILATRFPYRLELAWSQTPMEDHAVFNSKDKIDLIICEVKTRQCALNGPWTNPDKENMHRVLHAIGAFPDKEISTVADALYGQQVYEDKDYRVRLFAVGETKNESLSGSVVQLTWEEILTFIYERFRKYRNEKSQHRQWDRVGISLFNLMRDNRTIGGFVNEVKYAMGL